MAGILPNFSRSDSFAMISPFQGRYPEIDVHILFTGGDLFHPTLYLRGIPYINVYL